MNITIIGGGNVGTLMAAEFASKGHRVTIYTSGPEKWEKSISVYSAEEKLLFSSEIDKITNSFEEAVTGAECIWITLPAFMFAKTAGDLYPYVKKGQYIGIVPGSGGAEFAFGRLVDKGCILFGLQRVHSIARVREYGRSVYMLGRKPELKIGSIPSKAAAAVCNLAEELFDMKCIALENYLAVTLTPSNPILHTARLYTLFKDYDEGVVYPENILFYEEWDEESSRNLIACDKELQLLCERIPLPLSSVQSLQEYYESFTAEAMTDKIRGIKAFRGIESPMKHTENGWVPDFDSRYFTADFPWGLKIIKEIAELYEVAVPNIDKIWRWYEEHARKDEEMPFELYLDKDGFVNLYQ